ncbi:MAG: DUF5110 domain-containing protein [Muribaculaceae bacterium]|nr:DUF5110 domain-containing protein [Muribaculaceae bacterium]
MKKHIIAIGALLALLSAHGRGFDQAYVLPSGDTVRVTQVADNALRVRKGAPSPHVDQYFYAGAISDPTGPCPVVALDLRGDEPALRFGNGLLAHIDPAEGGRAVFVGPRGERLYGLGQFQDGYIDVRGLTRRLTQVNTQISVPMVISDAGYGILWNNCGLTDFNPSDTMILLTPAGQIGEAVAVDATSTGGNKREERAYGEFVGEFEVTEPGMYAFLLDVGQKMARKHYLAIDGKVLTQADNVWLPPTTSTKAYLEAGKHTVEVRGEKSDKPSLGWRLDDGTTTFASPAPGAYDYTVFFGTPDEIQASYRQLTGDTPMLPKWAYGYVHCRERYVSQADVLENATEFRRRGIPIDMIVQDWQWWGGNGWNAMKFDEVNYPDPKAMADSLHAMDIHAMLSVWAKVDVNSALGKELAAKGDYIPNTDWIDFFDPQAAEDYWQAYRQNLVPTGIDAWWQDATEPENDDLAGRIVGRGKIKGDDVRNVFPIVVNDRVWRGLLEERPGKRPMILTRCGAPGIQRYGVVTWSGDVGNDYETMRRQIAGGLGQSAAGLPWWTYDAGGFFRPGDQYSNADYQERMLSWIRTAAYLPMMRVHGYMSRTEPWRYSPETEKAYVEAIKARYELLPYIYTAAAQAAMGRTAMMRPLFFGQGVEGEGTGQFWLGRDLLVCPYFGEKETIKLGYVPGGWWDFNTGKPVSGYVEVADRPVVLVKAGAIIPTNSGEAQSVADVSSSDELTLRLFPGANGSCEVYDDDGETFGYAQGNYSLIRVEWNDAARELTIGDSEGAYPGYKHKITVVLPDGTAKTVDYQGKQIKVKI